jgi:hypothetical protein
MPTCRTCYINAPSLQRHQEPHTPTAEWCNWILSASTACSSNRTVIHGNCPSQGAYSPAESHVDVLANLLMRRSWLWIILTRRFPLYMISVILRLGCILVLVLTPAASDSFFDSAPEAAFYISNITEWRKDIPTPLVSGQDFPFSEFQDMHSSEPFELKDTASECSMDSAYQSQTSASRRGMKRPQPYSRDSQNTHPSSDIYSPSMRSETYSYQDMNQLHLPTAAGAWETTEYANYSTAQDFSLYPTSTQFTPASDNLPMQWGAADSQYQSAFNFPSYPMGQQAMFGSVAPSPQPWGSAHMSTERPSPARNSSFTALQNSHQTSNDAAFAALVASPVSTASAQLPVVDFDQQYQDQG